MFRQITNKIHTLSRLLRRIDAIEAKQDDVLAMANLQYLLQSGCYLPQTLYSIRPFNLWLMINDIVINQRRNVLEFGMGISTILIARLINRNELDCTLTSVEHNPEWIAIVQGILQKENLLSKVQIIHAPLIQINHSLNQLAWYDTNVLQAKLTGTCDMVIVDGPPSSEKLNRYPAYPFMADKLSASFSFYLDDAGRSGEKEVIARWEQQGLSFETINNSIALGKKEAQFSSSLRKY